MELLDGVWTPGIPFIGNEVSIQLDRQGNGTQEQAFLNFIYVPIRDVNDTITEIFAHVVDVTEPVLARQQADAAVFMRDQFLSIAAHELKTPLTSLMGYSQVLYLRALRAGTVDERTERSLRLIIAQGKRLNRLVDMLLDTARINMGHLSIDRIPVDVCALARRIVEEVASMLESHAIHIVIPDDACIIVGDALRLEQVLVNLIQNAIKYSPDAGAILVRVTPSLTHVCIAVRDPGIGIPVYVVQEIVMLHGGTVTVASTEGVGSTFTVCLPLEQSEFSTLNAAG